MTSTNVIEFAPALLRWQSTRVADAFHFGPWDRRYVAGIDGLWSEPPAAGVIVPFRR